MEDKMEVQMDEEYFKQLEMLNAQIDVWIDEEEFDQVRRRLKPSLKAEGILKKCFQDSKCTYKANNEWFDAFEWNDSETPIESIRLGSCAIEISVKWSHLFWAKLLRAYIQENGTDCYFRHLDEVVAYLENHLPRINPDKPETAKMAVIYLLEMSAVSIRYEQIGFAKRAQSIIKNIEDQNLFSKFYDLLARYNIGVAYFHDAQYRKAVLEFNYIIYELKNIKEDRSFFDRRECDFLLLWPSILYRADIQLKLQLAYHAFKTLEYLAQDQVSEYKVNKSKLIKVEAYQQMGWLDESWDLLKEVHQYLFKTNLGEEDSWVIPNIIDKERKNAKMRFFSLLIEDRLISLKNNKDNIKNLEKIKECFYKYFEAIQQEEVKRYGYYEQLSAYLAWLVESRKNIKSNSKKNEIYEVAKEVYQRIRSGLLECEPGIKEDITKDKIGKECRHCSKKGINLMRLDSEHYDQFTKDMLKFYEKLFANSKKKQKEDSEQNFIKQLRDDEEGFLERLRILERDHRENLEILQLELDHHLKKIKIKEQNLPEHALCFIESRKSGGFSGLLPCVNRKETGDDKHFGALHYEKIMSNWNTHFLNHLRMQSFHKSKEEFHFIGLQRWNSSSPAMGRSVGGGYLLYHTDKQGIVDMGIALDPGFDFVRNLFRMGFSLRDIDIILLSHAHLDHVRDFESIIHLLHELSDRDNLKKRLHVILTLGVYRRLEHIIESPTMRHYIEPYIIDIEKEIKRDYSVGLPSNKLCFCYYKDNAKKNKKDLTRYKVILPNRKSNNHINIHIYPTLAYHNDYSGYSDSFGFQIKLSISQDKYILFGYTGDTKWVPHVAKQYYDCDVLLVHLGSLIDCKKKDNRKSFEYYKPDHKACEELIREKNHPYLMGLLRLLRSISSNCDTRRRLILLSEFGEELRGGIRVDLIKRLKDTYGSRLDFLPVDVGLDVQLYKAPDENSKDDTPAKKVWCVQCDEFVDLEEADFERYGHDEALFCVCETCKRSTPQNVLWDRLRHLYEVGRELRPGSFMDY